MPGRREEVCEGMVKFYSKSREYRELSNFWPKAFVLRGLEFKAGEHAFHHFKFRVAAGERLSCVPSAHSTKATVEEVECGRGECGAERKQGHSEERRQKLLRHAQKFVGSDCHLSPLAAKKLGGRKSMPLEPLELAWWSKYGAAVQRDICRARIKGDPALREILVQTLPKYLLHQENRSRAPIWGGRVRKGWTGPLDSNTPIVGQNKLGKVWMAIRSECLREAGAKKQRKRGKDGSPRVARGNKVVDHPIEKAEKERTALAAAASDAQLAGNRETKPGKSEAILKRARVGFSK